jgi:hypothetical protein
MNAPLHPSDASIERNPTFKRRGFYLHGAWVMEYPFSVRSWERQDFVAMFRLLNLLGFNAVMIWPTPEAAPMPLSEQDAATLRGYSDVLGDAKANGLESWLAYCPNIISKDEVRHLPWKDRSLYASTQVIRLSDEPKAAEAYLDHRRCVLGLLDNADAFVVIDGDPGGYAGAPHEEYLRILRSDQSAVPGKRVIPWIWNGWGRDSVGEGYWSTPVLPTVQASLETLKNGMTGAWELLSGRSHREDWANGRVPVAETERAGLIARSTIFCYEAIEFEPSEPAAAIQFDLIRQALKQEGQFSSVAKGVFGNAQQPVMVLPNLYFFARGAADPDYLDKSDGEVLADFARELGDASGVLIPVWSCLKLSLRDLPEDYAQKVRALNLDTELAKNIPGGPQRYVEILAAQFESRRGLLAVTEKLPATAEQAANSLAAGAAALIRWWHVHHYVGSGRKGDPFQWRFLRGDQVQVLRDHAIRCAVFGPSVITTASRILAQENLLPLEQASQRLSEITPP